MKLLFDQNLSYKLVKALSREFPDSTHVRDAGLASADDLAVWEYAKHSGFTIVSKDSDFSQRSFLFGPPPKVIWLKLGNCSTSQIENVLRHYCSEIMLLESSEESAFLVVDPLERVLQDDLVAAKSGRIPVDSSVIASIGYDVGSGVLEVEFKATGEIYQYFEIPGELYEELLKADSKGAFLNSNIKTKYRFQKLL